MDAPSRKKHKALTDEERLQMDDDLRNGMTIEEAAIKYGVSEATVRRNHKHIPPDRDNGTFDRTRKRTRKRTYSQIDVPLEEYVMSYEQEKALTREDIKTRARKLASNLGFPDFRTSDSWLDLFLKCRPAVKERLKAGSASRHKATSLPQSVTMPGRLASNAPRNNVLELTEDVAVMPRPAKPSQHVTTKDRKSLKMAAVEELAVLRSGKPAGPIPQHDGMRNTLTSEKPSPRNEAITPTEQKMYQFFRNLRSGAKDYLNDVEWSVEKILDRLKNLLLSDVVPDDARPCGLVTRNAATQTETTTGDLGAVKKGDILCSGESDYEVVRVLHSGSTGQWVTCFKRETVDEMVQMKILREDVFGAFRGRCEIELKRHDVYESPGSFRQIFGCFRHKSRVCLFFDSRGASLFREWINERDFFTTPPFADVIMDEIRCYMVGALLELVGLCIMPDHFWRHQFPSNVFVFVLKANYTMVQMVAPSAQDGSVDDSEDSRSSAESSQPVQCPDQLSDESTNSSTMSPTIVVKAPSSHPSSFPRAVTIQGAGMRTAFTMQAPGPITAATTQSTGKRSAISPHSTIRKKRLPSFPESLVHPQSTATRNYSEQSMVLDINSPWPNPSILQVEDSNSLPDVGVLHLMFGERAQESSIPLASPAAAPWLLDDAFAVNRNANSLSQGLPENPAPGWPRDPMISSINEPWLNHSLLQVQGLNNVQNSKLPYLFSGRWYQEPSATTAGLCLHDAAFAGNADSFLQHSHHPQAPVAGELRDLNAPTESLGDLLWGTPFLDSTLPNDLQSSLYMAQESACEWSRELTESLGDPFFCAPSLNSSHRDGFSSSPSMAQDSARGISYVAQEPYPGCYQGSSAPVANSGDQGSLLENIANLLDLQFSGEPSCGSSYPNDGLQNCYMSQDPNSGHCHGWSTPMANPEDPEFSDVPALASSHANSFQSLSRVLFEGTSSVQVRPSDIAPEALRQYHPIKRVCNRNAILQDDMQRLKSPGELLDTRVLSAICTLARNAINSQQKYSNYHGMLDPYWVARCNPHYKVCAAVRDAVQAGKTVVQPCFDGSNHFVTVVSHGRDGHVVRLLDSMDGLPTPNLLLQIWALFNVDDRPMRVELPRCPQQATGSNNCLVYAAAFALDTLDGLALTDANYGPEGEFRNWIKRMLDDEKLLPTPRKRAGRGQNLTVKKVDSLIITAEQAEKIRLDLNIFVAGIEETADGLPFL
ncbi:hypothetical protein BV898_12070 [Hypsibius exemplaris]|uniref:HTH CENPB-type domain-containing protein n=1 Tax=Hypsibius exemplaris TaxID=2072580 RepID=A0A1W0WEP5_HYPEX|nr:hypothetical protein BV898_12070 [Hypsibius exemplaris]